MSESHTDWRSEAGVTVGLVDAIIAVCRVLAGRDLATEDVQEALKDLLRDRDFQQVMGAVVPNMPAPAEREGDSPIAGHAFTIKPAELLMALRSLRLEHGISMATIAEALGVGITSVSYYENGMRLIPLDTLERLAELYGYELAIQFRPTGRVKLPTNRRGRRR